MGVEHVTEKFSPQTDRTVHVAIPADVGFDLDRFQTIQKDILGRLGCPACSSGWDIRYDIQRRFIVDKNLTVQDAPMF